MIAGDGNDGRGGIEAGPMEGAFGPHQRALRALLRAGTALRAVQSSDDDASRLPVLWAGAKRAEGTGHLPPPRVDQGASYMWRVVAHYTISAIPL